MHELIEDKRMNLGSQTAKPMAIPNSNVSWKSADGVSDQFPAGLRVLVVDDDPTCLRILEKMLKNCLYEVTKCNRAEFALKLLQDKRNGYDIVISDVHMPDMDGFKLLEQIGLQMDLPVIMMSADDSKNVVMKGVTHGACDYLIKPVRIEALKNIWQHVVRKKKHEWKEKDFEQSGSVEDGERQLKPLEDVDYSSSATEGSWKNPRKRKDEDDEPEDKDDTSTLKKQRVVWSVELHQQFVGAVNQLGIDKAVPKKILELMNVPGLTRENVASHLQKYRLYLKRLSGVPQHQNGLNSSFMGNPDATFGSMSSINGLDFQGLAATGQIQAHSLASLQAASLGRTTSKPSMSMPMVDQRNLFSFDTQKLRFGEGQQQLNGNNKQMNLLHGIPTNMEPKQLASLNQSAQKYGGMNVQVNSQATQGNPLLMQMNQPLTRAHMLNENNANQISRLPSSVGHCILSNAMPGGVLGRNGVVDGLRGPVYNPVSQGCSLVDFSVNSAAAELPGNAFHHASTAGLPNLSSKGMIQEDVTSEVKGSIGFSPSYDIFSELQKAPDWGLQNVGSTFDASRHSDIQGSLDVQPGYSSCQKNQNRVGDSIFSGGESGQNGISDFGQHFNSYTLPDNSPRIKSERLPDTTTCQNSVFSQQYGQDDLMSALLKQEGIGSVESDFVFDGYALDNV